MIYGTTAELDLDSRTLKIVSKRGQGDKSEAAVASTSNPYATGGGGVTFERRVAVRYLACLLTGASSPELDDRRVVQVAFQQAPDHPVDDLVVRADRDGDEEGALELSIGVRRRPRFVTSDADTRKLIGTFLSAAHQAATEDFQRGLAIYVAGHQDAAAQVEELAGLARTRDAATFYGDLAVPAWFRRQLRDRLRHVKALVAANLEAAGVDSSEPAVDAATWMLLSQLHVVMPRLEPPDELDWAGLLDQLEPWAREPARAAAIALRSRLEALAARYTPVAAAVDLTMLRRDAHDHLNVERRRSQQAWAELSRLDSEARADVRSVMGSEAGSLTLSRPRPESELRDVIGAANLVVVFGDSGVGKSALAKTVIEAAEASGDVEVEAVMLNLRQLPAQMGELRAWLGQPLEALLGEISAPNRVLVIDAAEFVLESGDQMLRALIRAAHGADLSAWVVSATEGLAAVRNAIGTPPGGLVEIHVDGLTNEDIASVTNAFPALRGIAEDPRARELLRRPVVADFLARSAPGSVPLALSDVLEITWARFVRKQGWSGRGLPEAREQALLRLARHELEDSDPADVFDALNGEAIAGLRHDGLLRTPDNPWLTLPTFAHDLVRTFAVARYLLSNGDPAGRLLTYSAPRWAFAAARLAIQVMLTGSAAPTWQPAGRTARLQADFDRLAGAGFSARWSDLPTEAALALPNVSDLLAEAWDELIADEAAGLKRVLRIIEQQHSKDGLTDRLVAQPVVDLLLDRGWPAAVHGMVTDLFKSWLRALLVTRESAGEPTRAKLRDYLVRLVAAGDRRLAEIAEQRAAALAARTPEEKAADDERRKRVSAIAEVTGSSRQRKYVELAGELISESTMELLALLGPDLGTDGEELLRRVAEDDPHRLAPALESGLAGLGLSAYRPELLVELVEAYYLDDDSSADDALDIGFDDYGIRDHQPSGFGAPLAAYNGGPFVWMFRTSFRNGVACLNRLLNHATQRRVAMLHQPGRGRPDRSEQDDYRTQLSITGTPRYYIGDGYVWHWYRGTTGVEPYPCTSALQALELVCDEFIEAGAPVDHVVSVLLDNCQNLAMPALIVGLLVRHLEKAGDALDPFLVEPEIWHLESNRVVNESFGLATGAAPVKSPERRRWSLAQVAMMLAISADEARPQQLRELGDRLVGRAQELYGGAEPVAASNELSQELATIRGWAGALNRANYQFTRTDEGIVFEQQIDPEVAKILAGTNEDLTRGQHSYRIWSHYPERHDRHAKPIEVTLDELVNDLAVAKDLLDNPPTLGPPSRHDAPAAVAAAALEAKFKDRLNVPDEDLVWSTSVLFDTVEDRRSLDPNDSDEFAYFSQGADRSAARGLPLLLLPQAQPLRAELTTARGLDHDHIIDSLTWLLSSGANEARLFAAKAHDHVWATPCDHSAPCHHNVAFSLIEESLRRCRTAGRDLDDQADPPTLEGDIAAALDNLDGDEIIVPLLSPAIRALGAAASTANCKQDRAIELLATVLATHRKGMAVLNYGYQHSATDSLIAARTLLMLAGQHNDTLLLEHFDASTRGSHQLEEFLKALAAAAEENQHAADTARRLWPALIDRGLDLLGEPERTARDERWRRAALAAFMPNPSYDPGYLYRELDSDPIVWPDVEALRPQIQRWLPMAAGQRESVDSLVRLLHTVSADQQGQVGLTWVEILVAADPSQIAWTSYLLPEWLHNVRPHLHQPDLIDCWQRIVDILIVAGDTRVADLAD